jgi:LacI family transcriptional regulator
MTQTDSRNQATMSAIADAAAVSISTVSRVMAGGQGISRQTIDKVRKTANDLGYRPKPLAGQRSTSKQKQQSLKIGLLHTFVKHYTPQNSIQVFLHQKFIIETWQTLHQAGHQLCIDYLDIQEPSDRSVLLGNGGAVDGVIVKGAVEPKVLKMLPANLPAVILRLPMGMPCPYTSVNCNYHTGIARCVQYLHQLGHRRIAFFCLASQRFDNLDKITSYQQTLLSMGLDENKYLATPQLSDDNDTPRACESALNHWMSMPQPPTAIITSEGFCHDMADLLISRGKRIPQDISLLNAVTGASSYESMRQHYTRLQMPAQEMSQAAVEHLIRHIRNPQAPPQTVLMEMDFILGDTTAPPPASAS